VEARSNPRSLARIVSLGASACSALAACSTAATFIGGGDGGPDATSGSGIGADASGLDGAHGSGHDGSAGDASHAGDAGDAGTIGNSDGSLDGPQASEAGPVCGIPGHCVLRVPIPTTTSSSNGATVTACPGGPQADASPPLCVLELDLGDEALAFDGGPAIGTIPLRVQDLPWTVTILGSSLSVDTALGDPEGGTCSGSAVPPIAFRAFPVQIVLAAPEGGAPADAGTPVLGCDPADAGNVIVSVSSSDLVVCGCGLPTAYCDLMATSMASVVGQAIGAEIAAAVNQRACLQ
jgi:hypothetical protein